MIKKNTKNSQTKMMMKKNNKKKNIFKQKMMIMKKKNNKIKYIFMKNQFTTLNPKNSKQNKVSQINNLT